MIFRPTSATGLCANRTFRADRDDRFLRTTRVSIRTEVGCRVCESREVAVLQY